MNIGSPARAVDVGADDRLVAAVGTDGTVALFDARSGRRRWRTEVEGRPWDVALSPAGDVVAVSATVAGRGVVTLFALDRPESPLARFEDDRPVTGLAFDPVGARLVVGAGDPTRLSDLTAGVVVYDVASGRVVGAGRAHGQGVSAVAFSPDGSRIASVGTDETTVVWDAATVTPVGPPLRDERISGNHLLSVAFSHDGSRLATGGAEVTVWQLTPGAPTWTTVGTPLDPSGGGVVSSLDWLPDGGLVGGTAAGKVVRWGAEGRSALGRLVPGVGTDGAVLDPTGRWAAALGTEPAPVLGLPQPVFLVDVATGRAEPEPVATATAVAFGAGRDRQGLALARGDGSFAVVDPSTRTDAFAPRAQSVPIAGIGVSPDGATAALGRVDGSVVLVDTTTGEQRGAPLTGHEGFVPWLAFAPDGTTLLTAGIGGGALAWDLTRTPPVPRRLAGEQSLRVLGATYAPDGDLVATGSADGRVALLDGDSLAATGPATVGAGVVAPVGFTADGSVLATTGDDRTVRLYDVATRQQIGVPFPKGTTYGKAALSSDGTMLLSGSADGLVIWDVDPASWVRRACAAAGRNLTRAEWDRFLPGVAYRSTCPSWPAGR